MDAKHWAGLDVGVYRTSLCIVSDSGSIVHEADLASDPTELITACSDYPDLAAIALETGVGRHLMLSMREAGLPVVLFDAFKASRFLAVRRNKTDKNDARGLADLVRLGQQMVCPVQLREGDCHTIRVKLCLRQGIVKQRIAAENLLWNLLQKHGKLVPKTCSPKAYRSAITSLIEEITVEKRDAEIARDLIALLDYCEQVRNYNRKLNNELKRIVTKSAICRRLMTIPGVGAISALAFYSTIQDPWRFANIADVAAYVGLTPVIRETGSRRVERE